MISNSNNLGFTGLFIQNNNGDKINLTPTGLYTYSLNKNTTSLTSAGLYSVDIYNDLTNINSKGLHSKDNNQNIIFVGSTGISIQDKHINTTLILPNQINLQNIKSNLSTILSSDTNGNLLINNTRVQTKLTNNKPTSFIGATVKIGTATTYMTSDSAPALEKTGVTAGTYNYPSITVDETGRITGASSLTVPNIIKPGHTPTSFIGSVAKIGTATTYMTSDSAPALEKTGVIPGTYNYARIIVDSTGRITGASSLTIPNIIKPGNTPTATIGSVAKIGTATTYMTSDSAPALEKTGVTAGIYNYPSITVDSTGRITGASSLTAPAMVGRTPTATIGATVKIGTATTYMTSDSAPALEKTGVTAGTYNYATITVDSTGRIINASGNTISSVVPKYTPTATIGAAVKIGTATTYMTSDSAPALEKTGVTAGTYNYARITVDATGRIINASGNTISSSNPTATIGPVAKIGTATTYMTSDSAPALEKTGVTAGTYNYARITVDATGRIINASGNTISSSNPTATIGPVAKIGTATTYMTSDSAPALEKTGVTEGRYNYASITVDATGRIINATENTISSSNPTATIGSVAKIGTATTYMTSDSAPALEKTGVIPGIYLNPLIQIDETGRIITATSSNSSGSTSINMINSAPPSTAITGSTAIYGTAMTFMTSDSAPALSLTGVSAGQYQYATITVDDTGRITNAVDNTLSINNALELFSQTNLTCETYLQNVVNANTQILQIASVIEMLNLPLQINNLQQQINNLQQQINKLIN